MFQDILLIIKYDYLHKRNALLRFLLQQGFQIQGQRKLLFTPELAAEFYEDLSDDPGFMFQVILLSKGNSEAFILAKECAVKDLFSLMIYHFGSLTEMEKNVHVTKCQTKVGREISFIFPNYIHEPINCTEQIKFCGNNPLIASVIGELYDIVTKPENEPQKDWKEKLAEWLISSNRSLPRVSNQCCQYPNLNLQEIAQQTKITCFKNENQTCFETNRKCSLTDGINFDSDGNSLNITSSSCISCSGFGSLGECGSQFHTQTLEDIIKARLAPLENGESLSSIEKRTAKESVSSELFSEDYSVEEFGGDEEVEPVTTEGPLTLEVEKIRKASLKIKKVSEFDLTIASGDHTEALIVEEHSKSKDNNNTDSNIEESEHIHTNEPITFDEYEPANSPENSLIEDVSKKSANGYDSDEEDSPAAEDVE